MVAVAANGLGPSLVAAVDGAGISFGTVSSLLMARRRSGRTQPGALLH